MNWRDVSVDSNSKHSRDNVEHLHKLSQVEVECAIIMQLFRRDSTIFNRIQIRPQKQLITSRT
jgi:hypothetical protein